MNLICLCMNYIQVLPDYGPGRILTVRGIAPSTRFSINLFKGSDNTLHVNPRFEQNLIVLNTRFNGVWGPEEGGGSPIRPTSLRAGEPYTVEIVCQLYGYAIAINGEHHSIYEHRLAFSKTMTAIIRGGTVIDVRYI